MTLPEPECPYGYTYGQLEDILCSRIDEFGHWMRGQTMMLCDGRRWNPETEQYETGCDKPHGVVVYQYDLERFLAGPTHHRTSGSGA